MKSFVSLRPLKRKKILVIARDLREGAPLSEYITPNMKFSNDEKSRYRLFFKLDLNYLNVTEKAYV
jgi:hypothetical protein